MCGGGGGGEVKNKISEEVDIVVHPRQWCQQGRPLGVSV